MKPVSVSEGFYSEYPEFFASTVPNVLSVNMPWGNTGLRCGSWMDKEDTGTIFVSLVEMRLWFAWCDRH